MKKLIIIPLLFVSLILSATNYYVKNGGNDTYTGLSDVQAWATLTKVGNFATSPGFQPGDTVFLNRGDSWNTTLSFGSSGTLGNEIVITAYGTGAKPLIDLSIRYYGWARLERNDSIYYITGIYQTNEYLAIINGSDTVPGIFNTEVSSLNDDYEFCTTYNYPPSDNDTAFVYLSDPSDTTFILLARGVSGITTTSQSHLKFINLHTKHTGGKGIFNNIGANITIDSCIFDAGAGQGIHWGEISSGEIVRNIVKNNWAGGQWIVSSYNFNQHHNYYARNGEKSTTGDQQEMGFWYSHDFNVYNNYYWHDDPARSVLEASAFHQVVDNVKIYNNYFNVDGGSGVLSLCCGQTFEVYNNIFDCTDAADNQNELVGGGDQPTTWTKVDFYNNTAVGYGMMGYFTVWDESSDSGFYNYKNNILSAPLYRAFNVIVVTGDSEEGSYYDDKIVSDYNLYQGTVTPWYYRPTGGGISYEDWKTLTGNDTHSIIDDPEFAGVGNYQLQSTSPAIDAGTDVGVTTDYLGNLRLDTPDLGAYEYGASSVDSSLKQIVSYSFTEQTEAATINTSERTIDIEVEYGTDVTGLIATFVLSDGATAAVGATPQVSGTTENDFTSPVAYVITALDESTQEWTITVTVEEDPLPTVATVWTTTANYNSYKALVTGRIYSANGGTLTQRGICYSETNSSPTISDRRTIYTPYVGSFTDQISGLKGGTTYYFRAYGVTSEGGASYGDAITITTPAQTIVKNGSLPPTVNGLPVIIK